MALPVFPDADDNLFMHGFLEHQQRHAVRCTGGDGRCCTWGLPGRGKVSRKGGAEMVTLPGCVCSNRPRILHCHLNSTESLSVTAEWQGNGR